MIFRLNANTVFGHFVLESDGVSLKRLYLPGSSVDPFLSREKNCALLERARVQLLEYLAGVRRTFELELSPEGTEFQKRVWRELCRIPYGKCISYGELARLLGNEKACRAVGHANHCNPLPVFIPCHRVIAANGGLGGYAGGEELKRKLLLLERS